MRGSDSPYAQSLTSRLSLMSFKYFESLLNNMVLHCHTCMSVIAVKISLCPSARIKCLRTKFHWNRCSVLSVNTQHTDRITFEFIVLLWILKLVFYKVTVNRSYNTYIIQMSRDRHQVWCWRYIYRLKYDVLLLRRVLLTVFYLSFCPPAFFFKW